MAEIYRDNEGTVLKKLGKPVRRTVVDKNTRVSDDFDLDIPDESPSSRPPSKRTLIANAGPNSDGKIDFSVNPDCMDFLLQYHESYKHKNDAEGVKSTCEKVCASFNKTFKSSMTPPELESALSSRVLNLEAFKKRSVGQRFKPEQPVEKAQETAVSESKHDPESSDIIYAPLKLDRLVHVNRIGAIPKSESSLNGKVLLSGEKYEICKILNCQNICVVSRHKGKLSQNGLMHAACSASENGTIESKACPQEAPLSPKEELAYQLFIQQCGDEMKAKKMFFISKEFFSSK